MIRQNTFNLANVYHIVDCLKCKEWVTVIMVMKPAGCVCVCHMSTLMHSMYGGCYVCAGTWPKQNKTKNKYKTTRNKKDKHDSCLEIKSIY